MKLLFKKTSQIIYLREILHHFLVMYLQRNAKRFTAFKTMGIFSKDYIGFNIVLNGIYELRYLNFFKEFLELNNYNFEEMNVLDIGANIGNHTVYFSNYCNKVISFEPNIKVFKMLDVNTYELDNVEIFNFGLSNESGYKKFLFDEKNFGGGSLNSLQSENKTEIEILLKTLDEIAPLIDHNINLIKIDVEGHEYDVIRGGETFIKKHVPIFLFEQNSEEVFNGSTRTIDLLRSYGYNNFYNIENLKYSSIRFVNFIIKLFLGEKSVMLKNSYLLKKNYSFIIATI